MDSSISSSSTTTTTPTISYSAMAKKAIINGCIQGTTPVNHTIENSFVNDNYPNWNQFEYVNFTDPKYRYNKQRSEPVSKEEYHKAALQQLKHFLTTPEMTIYEFMETIYADEYKVVLTELTELCKHLKKCFCKKADYLETGENVITAWAMYDIKKIVAILVWNEMATTPYVDESRRHFGVREENLLSVNDDKRLVNPNKVFFQNMYLLYYGDQLPKEIQQIQDFALKEQLELKKLTDDQAELSNILLCITRRKVDFSRLHQKIIKMDDPAEQWKYFLSHISLTKEDKENQARLVEHLRSGIQRLWPASKYSVSIEAFGSFTNGLCMYNSDIDLVLKLNGFEVKLDMTTTVALLQLLQIILLKLMYPMNDKGARVIESKICSIVKMDFSVGFANMAETVYRENRKFSACDISINTGYGICNSKWLALCVEYDNRFYQMAILLKFWAKKNGLVSNKAFSAYSLTLMITFYLQLNDVLPSIETLQKLFQEQHGRKPVKKNGYCLDFCDDIELIRKNHNNSNNQTVEKLICGFFNYYKTFKFRKFAICPRLGQDTAIVDLPMTLKMPYEPTGIVIEDPFETDRNLGSRIFVNMHRFVMIRIFKTSELITEQNCMEWLINEQNWVLPEVAKSENQDKRVF